MSKEEVIDYVMTTPSNPNKAVLSGMLDSIANAGGGSTPGYECVESYQQFQSETIDIQGETSFYLNEQPDPLRVTLNGTSYICDNKGSARYYDYGDIDLTEYPFHIWYTPSGGYIAVAEDGEYEVAFASINVTVTSTPCFKKAVTSLFETRSFTAYNTAEETLTPNSAFNFALDNIYGEDGETISNLFEYDFALLKGFSVNNLTLNAISVEVYPNGNGIPFIVVGNSSSSNVTVPAGQLSADFVAFKITKS